MTASLEESYSYCRDLSRRTAGNFYYSFLTLPSDRFRDMCVLYAFMRHSDDIGDDETLPVSERMQRLTAFHHHVVADIHHVVDDGNPNRPQTARQPIRAGTDLHVANDARRVAIAKFGTIDTNLDQAVNRRSLGHGPR